MEFNEVIKRHRMVHAFTAEPLAPGTAERLLRAANRAPSAGFSQGYSFLVLEGKEKAAPFWQLLYEQTASEETTKDDSPAQVDALSTAPLVIVPLASKDVYLDRYARPEKGWTDRDEARMPIPYWYIDTGLPRCSCCSPPSTKDSAPCSSDGRAEDQQFAADRRAV